MAEQPGLTSTILDEKQNILADSHTSSTSTSSSGFSFFKPAAPAPVFMQPLWNIRIPREGVESLRSKLEGKDIKKDVKAEGEVKETAANSHSNKSKKSHLSSSQVLKGGIASSIDGGDVALTFIRYDQVFGGHEFYLGDSNRTGLFIEYITDQGLMYSIPVTAGLVGASMGAFTYTEYRKQEAKEYVNNTQKLATEYLPAALDLSREDDIDKLVAALQNMQNSLAAANMRAPIGARFQDPIVVYSLEEAVDDGSAVLVVSYLSQLSTPKLASSLTPSPTVVVRNQSPDLPDHTSTTSLLSPATMSSSSSADLSNSPTESKVKKNSKKRLEDAKKRLEHVVNTYNQVQSLGLNYWVIWGIATLIFGFVGVGIFTGASLIALAVGGIGLPFIPIIAFGSRRLFNFLNNQTEHEERGFVWAMIQRIFEPHVPQNHFENPSSPTRWELARNYGQWMGASVANFFRSVVGGLLVVPYSIFSLGQRIFGNYERYTAQGAVVPRNRESYEKQDQIEEKAKAAHEATIGNNEASTRLLRRAAFLTHYPPDLETKRSATPSSISGSSDSSQQGDSSSSRFTDDTRTDSSQTLPSSDPLSLDPKRESKFASELKDRQNKRIAQEEDEAKRATRSFMPTPEHRAAALSFSTYVVHASILSQFTLWWFTDNLSQVRSIIEGESPLNPDEATTIYMAVAIFVLAIAYTILKQYLEAQVAAEEEANRSQEEKQELVRLNTDLKDAKVIVEEKRRALEAKLAEVKVSAAMEEDAERERILDIKRRLRVGPSYDNRDYEADPRAATQRAASYQDLIKILVFIATFQTGIWFARYLLISSTGPNTPATEVPWTEFKDHFKDEWKQAVAITVGCLLIGFIYWLLVRIRTANELEAAEAQDRPLLEDRMLNAEAQHRWYAEQLEYLDGIGALPALATPERKSDGAPSPAAGPGQGDPDPEHTPLDSDDADRYSEQNPLINQGISAGGPR